MADDSRRIKKDMPKLAVLPRNARTVDRSLRRPECCTHCRAVVSTAQSRVALPGNVNDWDNRSTLMNLVWADLYFVGIL